MLNAFVLDKYDAYGEVPIPGSSSLHLPAGDVDGQLPHPAHRQFERRWPTRPAAWVTIVPPEGVEEPQVTENYGTTTTVNNDARVRVWVAAGSGRGRLRHHHRRQCQRLHQPAAGVRARHLVRLAGLGVRRLVRRRVAGADGRRSSGRSGRESARRAPSRTAIHIGDSYPRRRDSTRPVDPYTPSADGIRIEQLKNLGGPAGLGRADRGGVRDREAPHAQRLTRGHSPVTMFR